MMFCPNPRCKMWMKPMGFHCEFCGTDLRKWSNDPPTLSSKKPTKKQLIKVK